MNLYGKSYMQRHMGRLSGGFGQEFAIVETILRKRTDFFAEIRDEIGLGHKIQAMVVSIIAFLAIYGAVLGSTHSLLQAFSSAVKMPVLFLATLVVCIPTLYIFSLLFGASQRLQQNVAVVLAAITVTATLLLSVAPIAFFFLLTTNGYQFFKLLNVFFFAVASFTGMGFLSQGMRAAANPDETQGQQKRTVVLYLWILLYIFVGSQMAWTLRPFVGYPGSQFELVRELGGNFFGDILLSIGEVLGFLIVM